MAILDILLESRLMFLFGVIGALLLKFLTNINLFDAFGAGLVIFLMLNFMVIFILQGIFNYK